MKKIVFITVITGMLVFTSCKKDEIGGTATEKIAGEWIVKVDLLKADGSLFYTGEDFFGLGEFKILTYNTAKNVSTEMWLDDVENFWKFKVVVNLNYDNATFSTNNFVDNYYYESQVKITNGKVLYNAAKTPSGMPADSIVFYVSFDDDTYPENYGYENYKIAGYRYTGFNDDEPHH